MYSTGNQYTSSENGVTSRRMHNTSNTHSKLELACVRLRMQAFKGMKLPLICKHASPGNSRITLY